MGSGGGGCDAWVLNPTPAYPVYPQCHLPTVPKHLQGWKAHPPWAALPVRGGGGPQEGSGSGSGGGGRAGRDVAAMGLKGFVLCGGRCSALCTAVPWETGWVLGSQAEKGFVVVEGGLGFVSGCWWVLEVVKEVCKEVAAEVCRHGWESKVCNSIRSTNCLCAGAMPAPGVPKISRAEAPAAANTELRAAALPEPPKDGGTKVPTACKALNPRDFVRVQPLPALAEREGKVLARSWALYRSSGPPSEQVCWEKWHRRERQRTQGLFTPRGKPYQELGELLCADPKQLTLRSLGQLAQVEPAFCSSLHRKQRNKNFLSPRWQGGEWLLLFQSVFPALLWCRRWEGGTVLRV